jgi:hypothetical protein
MGPLSSQQGEKGPVAAIRRVAAAAPLKMGPHDPALFVPEFLVQIFPEADQNLFTFHPLHPR